MKLTAWLRHDHPFPERLQIVERLAQAVNEVHDRGEPLAALDPDRLEVDDGECDITGARRGTPASGYCAPERAEGGPPSPEADIYAAGAIAWEILAGRQYASAPSHLAEAAPDVPRELADAVMACLEQSPQWRPRDLTYIAQLAEHILGQSQSRSAKAPAAARGGAGGGRRRTAARTSTPRTAAPLRGAPTGSRSHVVIAAVAATAVLAAAGGYYWLTRGTGGGPSTPALSVAAAPFAPTAAPGTAPAPTQDIPTEAPPTIAPPTSAATSLPTALPTPVAATERPPTFPTPSATPVPTPVPVTLPPMPVAPATTPGLADARRIATPVPPPTMAAEPATTTTTTTAVPGPVAVREPVVLSAVSPLSVRRPGKVVFDLRGSGLRPDLRARIVPLKDAPRGITVLRQACKGSDLVQVLVELDATVAPGAYAITLQEASGAQTRGLTFTVTK